MSLPPPYSDRAPQRARACGRGVTGPAQQGGRLSPRPTPRPAPRPAPRPTPHVDGRGSAAGAWAYDDVFRNGCIIPVSPACPDTVWTPGSCALLPTPVAYLVATDMAGSAARTDQGQAPPTPNPACDSVPPARDMDHDESDALGGATLDWAALLAAMDTMEQAGMNKAAKKVAPPATFDNLHAPLHAPPSFHDGGWRAPSGPPTLWDPCPPSRTVDEGVAHPPQLSADGALSLLALRACQPDAGGMRAERGWYMDEEAWSRSPACSAARGVVPTRWLCGKEPEKESSRVPAGDGVRIQIPGTLRLSGPFISALARMRRAVWRLAASAPNAHMESTMVTRHAAYSPQDMDIMCALCHEGLLGSTVGGGGGVAVVYAARPLVDRTDPLVDHADVPALLPLTSEANMVASQRFQQFDMEDVCLQPPSTTCVSAVRGTEDGVCAERVDEVASLARSAKGWGVMMCAAEVEMDPRSCTGRGACSADHAVMDVAGRAWGGFVPVHLSCMPRDAPWVLTKRASRGMRDEDLEEHAGAIPRQLDMWLTRIRSAKGRGDLDDVFSLLQGHLT